MLKEIMVCVVVGLAIYGAGIGVGFYLDNPDCPQCVQDTCKYEKVYDGLRFEGNYSHPQALEKAREYDEWGDWVCVNVRDMSFERGLETCNHEMGHEIFAEVCEKNITKCLDVMK